MNGSADQARHGAAAETHDGQAETAAASAAAIEALAASGPAPDRADGLALFGQLVGSWAVDATYYDDVGNLTERRRAEWHFGRILEGRAVQDVLFGPPASERRRTGAPAREYGSTIRMYDPRTDVWHASWFAPVHGAVVHLAGGRVGEDIVLEGTERTDQRPLVQQMHARRIP